MQLHPLDDSVEQRQGPDVIGPELEAIGLGVFAWDDFPFGAAWCGSRAIGDGFLFGHCGSPQGWPAKIGGRVTRGPRMAGDNQRRKDFCTDYFIGVMLITFDVSWVGLEFRRKQIKI